MGMSVESIVQQMLILLAFMVVGFIACRTNIIDKVGNEKLNKVGLYICQPALVFAAVLNNELTYSKLEVLKFIGVDCLLFAVFIALSYVLMPLLRPSKESRGTFRFMLIFGNCAFMGYPVVASLFGDGAIFLASLMTLPFNLLSYSYGIVLMTGHGLKFDKKLFLNPAFISTLLSLVIFFCEIKAPYVICEVCDTLGDMTIPCAMLVIGATLGQMHIKTLFGDWRIYVLCVLRLIVIPIVAWLVCRLVVTDELFFDVVVVQCTMPVAAVASILSIEYKGDILSASRGVFMTTVLSVVTVPLMTWLLLMH